MLLCKFNGRCSVLERAGNENAGAGGGRPIATRCSAGATGKAKVRPPCINVRSVPQLRYAMISDRLGCVAFETRSKPAHDRIRVVRVPAIERRVNSDRGNRIEANPEIMVLQVAAVTRTCFITMILAMSAPRACCAFRIPRLR